MYNCIHGRILSNVPANVNSFWLICGHILVWQCPIFIQQPNICSQIMLWVCHNSCCLFVCKQNSFSAIFFVVKTRWLNLLILILGIVGEGRGELGVGICKDTYRPNKATFSYQMNSYLNSRSILMKGMTYVTGFV